jgi:hypothetical protein
MAAKTFFSILNFKSDNSSKKNFFCYIFLIKIQLLGNHFLLNIQNGECIYKFFAFHFGHLFFT